MININNAVQFQHLIWDRSMKKAKVVVDATCGNGHDLLYLAKRAQKGCHLFGRVKDILFVCTGNQNNIKNGKQRE